MAASKKPVEDVVEEAPAPEPSSDAPHPYAFPDVFALNPALENPYS